MDKSEATKEALLAEIRRTGDSFAILKYANWLEQQGEHSSCEVLRAIESRLPISTICALAAVRDLADVAMSMNREMQTIFSFNCAYRVLPWFDNLFLEDRRPRIAIDLARRIGTLERDCQAFQDAVNATKVADRTRWEAVSTFYGEIVDPRAALRTERDAAYQAKKTAIAAGVLTVEMAEAAFFAARTVVYVCQGSPVESVARSAAFACGKSKTHEEDWQLHHAIRILYLGEIPLTEAERINYVKY